MTIEKIDDSRLLIALCNEDMEVFSLDYEKMCLADPYYRKILKRLLSLAGVRTGIDTRGKTLLVESMPHSDGCIFLITLVPKGERGSKRYKVKRRGSTHIYGFESIDDMLLCLENLYKAGFVRAKSDVYRLNNRYSLVLKTSFDLPFKAKAILSEFCSYQSESHAEIAAVKEYGTAIAHECAIMLIGGACSQ